jgi:alkaline phosphatase D
MNLWRAAAALSGLTLLAGGLIGCSEGGNPRLECAGGEGPITHGPRLGAVSESSINVWIRGCTQVSVNVQYRVAGGTSTTTDSGQDGTAVVELSGLEANTAYSYRMTVDGEPDDELGGEFRTLPATETGTFTFAFGADIRPEGSRVTFTSLLAKKPAFTILYGDQIYVDPQLPPATPHFDANGTADYEAVYRKAWAVPEFRELLANSPTYMMWDDHEILNDYDDERAPPFTWAREAYQEYQNSANSRPYRDGELYYVIRAGPVEIFVLDERTYRLANNQRDTPRKTMLGSVQKADLKAWLLGSTAKFKFIVSPVMFSDLAKHTEEAWPNFKTERNEILDYITDRGIPGVVLISGDEHWTAVLKLEPWGLYEIAPTPLAGFSGVATEDQSNEVLFRLGQTAVFGQATVDTTTCPASLRIQVIDGFGRERFALPLTEAELTRTGISDEEFCSAAGQGRGDSDHDGCTDAAEAGSDAALGGQRDPLNHWDFYDVNGDRRVDSRDALVVSDALGLKIGDDGYDPTLDRSEPTDDKSIAGPPDGTISDDDVFLVTAQVGASCAGA